jgi:ADP-ribosylation factor-like protein 3
LAGVPILVYANKQDLISALPADEIEEMLCLSLITDRAWNIAACSATEKEGKPIRSDTLRFVRRT